MHISSYCHCRCYCCCSGFIMSLHEPPFPVSEQLLLQKACCIHAVCFTLFKLQQLTSAPPCCMLLTALITASFLLLLLFHATLSIIHNLSMTRQVAPKPNKAYYRDFEIRVCEVDDDCVQIQVPYRDCVTYLLHNNGDVNLDGKSPIRCMLGRGPP